VLNLALKRTNVDIVDKPVRQAKRPKSAFVGPTNSSVTPVKFRAWQHFWTDPSYNMGPSNIKDLLYSSDGRPRTSKAWSEDENQLLLELKNLPINWKIIAARSLGCSVNACRERYFKVLGNAAWNEDEEAQLAYLYNM
jgi:hypothetical protein